ncbi:MAG: hypothetical protein IBX57_00960 [Gammaproteobacteria bacterium]|nr:hypothetical protein [Gammaproteobacteria bacterium]
MYTFINAFVKEKTPRSVWIEKDISSETMNYIFSNYLDVLLVLDTPFIEKPQTINIRDLPPHFEAQRSFKTLIEWLVSIGSFGLELTDFFPDLNYVTAEYRNAFQAGYDAQLVNPNQHHTVNSARYDQTDLRITREGTDYLKLYNECLFTVNGILHRTNYVEDALHVVDGGKSNQVSGENHLGIYHLGMLGNIKLVPITREHVHSNGLEQPLGEVAYIKIDERYENLEGKTVLMSLGGYLHILDEGGVLSRVNERLVRVNFKDYNLPARVYDLMKRIDTSRITRKLSKSTVNPKQFSVAELYSDDVIKDYCSMSQSFFIIVDTPTIHVDKETPEFSSLPGKFYYRPQPKYPMITYLGVMSDYWVKKERDIHVLSMRDHLKPNYIYETTHWRSLNSIDDSKVPSNMYEFNRGYLLKLSKQKG